MTMSRISLRVGVAAAWTLCGALIVAPLWDLWYYHGSMGVHALPGSVGMINAYPNGPSPGPSLPLPAVADPATRNNIVTASQGPPPGTQATPLEAGARAETVPPTAPHAQPPVNAAHSHHRIAPLERSQGAPPSATRTSAGSPQGGSEPSAGLPAAPIPVGLVAAGNGPQAPQNGSSPNRPVVASGGPGSPTGGSQASGGTTPEPPRPADEHLRLAVSPQKPSVLPGELLPVAVVLEGGHQVTSVPFHLKFNPDILEYVGIRTGPMLSASSLQPIILASVNPNRPGDLVVGMSVIDSSGMLNGSGTILLLDFRALIPGLTDLVLERASVRGPTSEPLPADIVGSTAEVR